MEFSICIDVDDVDRAVVFYGRGLGLTVVEAASRLGAGKGSALKRAGS